MEKRGFTLIELLVVISIIALLSSVVLSSLNAARDKARLASGKQFSASLSRVAGELAVGIWDFDEGTGTIAGDRSGNGNNGVLTNGPTWQTDTPSGFGRSIRFDGINDYILIPDSASLDITSPYSISMWFKAEAWDKAYNVLISKAPDSGFNSTYGFSGPQGASTNVWHHYAVTFDGTTRTHYIDGKIEQQVASTPAIVSSGGLYIGEKFAAGGHEWQFNGYIDEVRIFAKGLTALEIRNLYALESARALSAASSRGMVH